MKNMLPRIILIGRPNVGKSTLFNRLIGKNRAITHDRAGITRDWLEGQVKKTGLPQFSIIDTGGITLNSQATTIEGPDGIRGFEKAILEQTEIAIKDACAIAFVVDGQSGLIPLDEYLANYIRQKNIPIICIVNKIDSQEKEFQQTSEFHKLGFDIIPVSAAHGYNINSLYTAFSKILPSKKGKKQQLPTLKLALIGRPNAGKSSLINALSGLNRLIVSEIAGTTRDSIDVYIQNNGKEYIFVDTAGIRKRTKITDTVEKFSVNSSIKSTTKADITLLVLDATEIDPFVSQQDKRLMDMLDTRKTPFIILLNKCDLIKESQIEKIKKELKSSLAFCAHIPILTVSAKDKTHLKKILPLAEKINDECNIRIGTGQLNRAMEEVLSKHQPPVVKQSRPKFFYLTQAETAPPTFVFFVSDASRVSNTYCRYLERSLRKLFAINHAPMRIHLRSSHNKTNKK